MLFVHGGGVRGADRPVPRPLRRPAGDGAAAPGSCCRTTRSRPSTLARLVRADDRPGRAVGARSPAGRCSPATRPAAATRSRSRRRCATAAARSRPALLLHSPWVDLTDEHARDRRRVDAIDPWLFLGKLHAYAEWWAGSPDDLGRPEVSPALGDLAGLPPALMFCGTRDLLVPGCRLLARRAAEADWDADLRRGARPDPRLPAAAVHPRGAAGVAADAGVPRGERSRAVPFDDLDARDGVRRLAAAAGRVRRRAGVPLPRPRRPRPRARAPATCCSTTTTASWSATRASSTTATTWRIGRVVLAPGAAAAGWPTR